MWKGIIPCGSMTFSTPETSYSPPSNSWLPGKVAMDPTWDNKAEVAGLLSSQWGLCFGRRRKVGLSGLKSFTLSCLTFATSDLRRCSSV